MFMSRKFRLDRLKMLDFLDEMTVTQADAISLYIPRGTSQDRIEYLLGKVLDPGAAPPGVTEAAARSGMGAVLFWSPERMYVILPPFQMTEEYITEGHDVEPLHSLLSQDFITGLVLVRLGAYSTGICRGTELIDSKTGTGLVHARHKKGGSSQARFARHREKQIEQFLIRVCGHVRDHIEPHARSLDYLVYGGARTTIALLRKQCLFLRQFDDRILRMLLDIPDPRQTVLEKAVRSIWSTDVIEWREDN
jgi:peptide subunit release factor 1 (eRF1)